jgi:dihydroorotase
MTDLVVEGRTLGPEGPEPITVGIQDDRFVEPDGSPDVVFDEGYLLPAAIDAHVHFREPGDTHKEDIQTGTTSAAFGGVAMACQMPNTDPPTATRERYRMQANRVEASAIVDVGTWAGVGPEMKCFELGDEATGYKLYAGPTTGDLMVDDPDTWIEAVERAADTDRPLAVHAEDPDILAEARRTETDLEDPASHARMRPPEAEVRVLERLAPRAARTGARLHAAHTSDPRSIDVVREHDLTCEVTPHHLFLDTKDVEKQGARAKVNPPIRSPTTREKLWEAFKVGHVDCLASDHAPHTLEEKAGSFHEAPSGLPGVETLYPLALARCLEGELSIERVIETCCEGPAELLGLPAGRIEPGLWANLVHAPEEPEPIGGREVHTRCGWTPFEETVGVFPDHVMVRGSWVVEDHELAVEPGYGRFVGGPAWD